MKLPILNRRFASWALYDFANSFAVTVFGVYFSQWLVVDRHISDLGFNLIFIASSFLLLLTAPVFGIMVDKMRVELPSLRIVTFFSFISLLGCGLLAVLAPPTTLVVSLVLGLLIAGQYFYQISYVFYDPLLKELGDETAQAKLSGLGNAVGGIGQLSGLLLTLPLATGAIYLFGHHDESQVFVPTAIIFLLCTLPLLLTFKEAKRPVLSARLDLFTEIKQIGKEFRHLTAAPGVGAFLGAYFLFNDAVLTAGHNFPIYIKQVFSFSDQSLDIILASVLLMAVLGAVSSGWIAARVGEKRLLSWLLAIWCIMLPLTALQRHPLPFEVCMAFVGILLGATAGISRALMVSLAPPGEVTHAFSYYAMSERLASFVGPFTWGAVTYLTTSHGVGRYQIALASMTVFVFIGLLILRKVPNRTSSPVSA